MSTSNAVRFLASGANDYGLSPVKFLGMVIKNFRSKTVFWDNMGRLTAFKTITEGNSHQFILADDLDTVEEHTAGTELLGQNFEFRDGTVTVDKPLVRHFDIPMDQKRLSHFDVQMDLAARLGRDLAREYDKRLARLTTLTARLASVTNFHNGGNRVEAATNGDLTTAYPATTAGADAFVDDVAQLGQLWDEDGLSEDGRWLFISPYIRRVLSKVTLKAIFDKDLSTVPNDLNKRVIGLLEGFTVMVTNHLPSANVTTGPSKYQGDFRFDGTTGRPAAVAMLKDADRAALGVVQAEGVRVVIQPDERRGTVFVKGQIFMGASSLYPPCAGEIFVNNV